MNRIRSFVLAVVAAALMGAGALAQVTTPPAGAPDEAATTPAQTTTPTTPAQTTTPATPAQTATPATPAQTTTPVRRGFDWGWIGLLGLPGLAGLTRREARPVDRTAAYPATRTDATKTPRDAAR